MSNLVEKYGLGHLIKRCDDEEEHHVMTPEDQQQMEAFAQRWVQQQAEVETRGIIFITGLICNEGLAYATRKILTLHFDQNFKDDIQIIINSGGGYVDAGWAFVDLMGFVDNRIVTIAMGEVGSMAASIFMAGDYRIMSPNSCAMIHHFSGVAQGNYRDLIAQRKSEDMEYQRLIKLLTTCSKYNSEEEVRKHLLLDQDNWLSPKEMKQHGLCDQIYQPRKLTKKGVEKRLARK